MKKLIIILLLFTAARSFGQGFPTTDSLHKYDNRFITNSAINAFTDYRLNSLLHGIINWIDSARLGTGGTVGMDTLYTVNDSTLRYKKNGLTFTFSFKGVYDNRRKADTLYRVNDSTVGYTINGQARSFVIRGNSSGGGGGGSPASPDKSIQFRQNSTTFGAATATWDSALNLFPRNKYSTASVPSLKYNGLVHNIIDTASAYQIDNIRSYDPRWGNWYHFTSIFPNAAGGTIRPSENFVWSNGYNVSKNGRVIDTLQGFSFNFETNFPTASDSTSFSELYWTHSPVTAGSPSTLEDRRLIFYRMSNGKGLGSRKYENTVFGSSMTQQFWYEWRDSLTQTMQQYFTISQGGITMAGNYNSNIPAISIGTRTNPNHSSPDPIFYYRSSPIISVASDWTNKVQIGSNNTTILMAGQELSGYPGVGPLPYYINQAGGAPIQFGVKGAPDVSLAGRIACGSFVLGYYDSTNNPLSTNMVFTRPDGDGILNITRLTTLQLPSFSIMQLGGTSSSNPALKRSSANLQIRLGDDSGFGDLEVAGEAYGSGWDGSNEVPTKNDVYDKIQTVTAGSGNTNSNIGSGYRLAVPLTNNIKTLFGNNTITIDSSSNSNALTIKADTSYLATQYDLSLISGGSGTPGGSNGDIQYKNGSSFAGSSNLHWDNSNIRLGIGTSSPATTLEINEASPVFRITNNNDASSTSIYALNGGDAGLYLSAVGWSVWLDRSGKIGTNNITSPTAWLHLPSSTTGAASLRLAGGVTPTSPNDGELWNDTTSHHLKVRLNGTTYQLDQQGGTNIGTSDLTVTGNRTLSFNGTKQFTFDSATYVNISGGAPTLRFRIPSVPKEYMGIIPSSSPYSYQFGFTHNGSFDIGASYFVDTLNNFSVSGAVGSQPLYSTGGSLTAGNGFVSAKGNFFKVSNITTNTTIDLTYNFITIDATSGNVTITLPAASSAFGGNVGIRYIFKRMDASGNTVTIQRAGSDTIDGATTTTLTTQYQLKELQCITSSAWAIGAVK